MKLVAYLRGWKPVYRALGAGDLCLSTRDKVWWYVDAMDQYPRHAVSSDFVLRPIDRPKSRAGRIRLAIRKRGELI